MTKEHIVINSDRTVTIPASVKTIAVQYDHNVETIIFDCPRYWNGLDMSTMRVYINYVLPDGTLGAYLADDVTIDEQDDTIMHFSWTITRNVTQLNGSVTFLVCVKNVDSEGNETNHWNSAISKKLLLVSEGLECSETVMEDYPDLVSQLLLKADEAVKKSDYSPAEKTDAMTQPVGKDANGKLWTAPTGGGSSGGNIISFGAVGDGVADDTEALIAAANSGMPIYFPAGTYLLHQQIDLNKDICWYGDGENTIIKLMPSDKSRPEEYDGKTVYNCYMIASTTENRVNVEMRNIVLDANKDDFDADIYGNGATRYDHTTCFDLKKPASVKLLNVTVKNALIEGCYIWCSSDTKYITIDNCRFINNGYYQKDASGLHIEGNAKNAVISNCTFADNGFHGLLIAGDNGKYSNITTHDNGYDGVCIWGGGSHNLLSNIYSFNNRGGIHIKLAYSAWHIDIDDDGYANSNMLENIHTANNKYGIIFGNNQNTKISGWTSEDNYCYALASEKYCSGNIINELLTPKTAFGELFRSVEVDDFTVNFGYLFKEVYPLGATEKGLSTVNLDQILDPDNYPLSESEAVPTYTTLAIELGGLSRSDGTETERSDSVRTVDYIPVLTGKSYILTNGGGYKVCVLCYDASKNFITNWAVDGEIAYSYKYVNSGTTFNIPNNTAYIRFYSSASSDTSVEYTITNENGNISTIGSRAEFVKQYFRNHGYAIYGENIDNATMHKLVIDALGLDSNTYNIVEIKAPTSDPQESTICLMNSGNGKTQFVDISSMVYDADKPTVEIVCQTRGGKKLPEFSIRYNDGSGAGRVKKFAVKPDAIPVELTAEGLRIRKTNAFDNNGLDDDYITVNFVDLLDEISGKVPKTDYSPTDKTDAMSQPVGKDADGKLWTAPGGGTGGSAESILYTEQSLTAAQQLQARTNIMAADAEQTQIIKRTDTMPDHDGLPLIGKTISLRGGMFENAHNYVTDAENLIPYPYSFAKTSPRRGITFYNTGRLLRMYGTTIGSTDGFAFTGSVPLPETIAPGDNVTLRVFALNLCPSSVYIRVQFLDTNRKTVGKLTCYANNYENYATLTVPSTAVSMNATLKLPEVDESVDTILMPVLLKSDDVVERFDPLAEGELMTIDKPFDGASHITVFPCDCRVEYGMRTQTYIDEDRSCITPEAFGAEGNGHTDDTDALRLALEYAQEKGIAFRAYRKYKTSDTLHITKDGADVEIHELIYVGTDAAIQIESSNIQLTTHIVRSNGSGVVLRSDNSAILYGIYHLGEVHSNGNAFGVILTNYPISINQVHFSVLDAGKVGDCVNYSKENAVDGAYCGEFVYYGGIAKHGVWAFNGLMGSTKMFNVDIENNLYGGINLNGALCAYGLRNAEDQRDLPGPFLKIAGTRPLGVFEANQPIDINKIDLTEAVDWYQTAGDDTQKTIYANVMNMRFINGMANTVDQSNESDYRYHSASSLGKTAYIVGKKILIEGFPETMRVITETEFDMSANGFDYRFSKMIPTIYVAGTEMSIVRLHPSFASFCHSTVTVIQTETNKITMYDCEGHLVFDGQGYGAGTYKLQAYHDYDDDGEIGYATHLPLIDYSREKWMLV